MFLGRLPFKPLPTKDVQTVSPLLAGAASKKRKLSDSANTSKAKCPKSDENSPKLNVKKIEAGDNEVSSSSETLEQVVSKKQISTRNDNDIIKINFVVYNQITGCTLSCCIKVSGQQKS